MNLLSLINSWLDIICQVTTKCATVPKHKLFSRTEFWTLPAQNDWILNTPSCLALSTGYCPLLNSPHAMCARWVLLSRIVSAPLACLTQICCLPLQVFPSTCQMDEEFDWLAQRSDSDCTLHTCLPCQCHTASSIGSKSKTIFFFTNITTV